MGTRTIIEFTVQEYQNATNRCLISKSTYMLSVRFREKRSYKFDEQ